MVLKKQEKNKEDKTETVTATGLHFKIENYPHNYKILSLTLTRQKFRTDWKGKFETQKCVESAVKSNMSFPDVHFKSWLGVLGFCSSVL